MARKPSARLLALAGGVLGLLVGLLPPLEPLADRFLWAHMLQHELFIFVAAPLLVAGVGPAIARRVPSGPARAVLAFLTRPAAGLGLSTLLLWAWHAPAAYDLALEHDLVHGFEHLCFLGGFALFWWPLLVAEGPPFRRLETDGGRVLYLLVGAMQGGVLAGLIAFSGHVVYPFYLAVPRGSGLTALADQQLAGMLMLLVGAVVYAVAAVALVRGEVA